jgi:predicted transport protein
VTRRKKSLKNKVTKKLVAFKKQLVRKINVLKRNKKKLSFAAFKKRLMRITYLYLILGLIFTPITHCYYADIEDTNQNTFAAQSLNFALTNVSGDEISQNLFDNELVDGEEATQKVIIEKTGTLGFKYDISVTKTGGDDNLCDKLQVGIERDGVGGIYNDDLLNLDPTLDLSGNADEISFRIYINNADAELQDKKCEFDIEFEAKQKNISSGGFSFSKTITNNTIETGWWVDPTVAVESPNGGETFTIGDTVNINWDADSTDPDATVSMKVTIKLSTDNGANYTETLATDIDNTGSFAWIADKDSSHLRIKVIAKDSHNLSGDDESNSSFSSVPPIEPAPPEP